jgi:hypothetical protein
MKQNSLSSTRSMKLQDEKIAEYCKKIKGVRKEFLFIF